MISIIIVSLIAMTAIDEAEEKVKKERVKRNQKKLLFLIESEVSAS